MTSDVGALADFPYLTQDEFAQCIRRFVERYAVELTERGVTDTGIVVRGRAAWQQYLQLRKPLLSEQKRCDISTGPSEDSIEAELEDADPLQQTQPPESTTNESSGYVEYHIVYSRTWRVPVVYVRAYQTDEAGNMQAVLEVGRVVDLLVTDNAVRGAMAAVDFGGALGIQDHPVLGHPFLYLHPCHTATLLRAVVAPSSDDESSAVQIGMDNYVAAWLSLVGPAVGLALPCV
ncbi:E2-like conjugating enzyme atg10 [Coemansia guatemalensis]|uniref:Ubiquitin-like-conjugating enzyme ATG10 n=1 Tax=Coemansia guatemalensis TaxID=2761395 RepID=A0A9W8HT91_9FUNG|nr:E2-like conjugating enzyme atg10 [Coemansia guatemalensis]